jgi:AcrR family transcriptional regulator
MKRPRTGGTEHQDESVETSPAHATSKALANRALLVDAGEFLIGRRGIDGVTLNEIAELAGQPNSNVLQYHFRDKAGLIDAILEDRTRRVEALRLERLSALRASDKQIEARELLAALWMPTLTFKDQSNDHVFCRFLLQINLHPQFAPHERGYSPLLVEIVTLLRDIYKQVPQQVFARRLFELTLMFIACAVELDNSFQSEWVDFRFDPESVIDMAVVALSAPVSTSALRG